MNGPGPIPGVFLAKTPEDPEEDKLADDVMDLFQEIRRGASTDYVSQDQVESEKRAEREFWTAVAERLDRRCGDWLGGKVRVTELGTRDGWFLQTRDRYGRTFPVEVRYSELAEVAVMQRAHDTEHGPDVIANHIVDKIEAARKRYFERAGLA